MFGSAGFRVSGVSGAVEGFCRALYSQVLIGVCRGFGFRFRVLGSGTRKHVVESKIYKGLP